MLARMISLPWQVPAGALVWLVAVCAIGASPFEAAWAWLLLALAPLVLVPLGLSLVGGGWPLTRVLLLPAALLFGVAYLLPQGWPAALCVLPWLLTAGLIGVQGVGRLHRYAPGPVAELCLAAGLIYLVVGPAWAMLDRLALRPLDFEAVIVLLTAIHFHYAGFVLPVLTGLVLRESPGRLGQLAGVGVIASVPLVAVGITATQLGWGPGLECLSAWVLALAALAVAVLQARLALRPGVGAGVRALWLLSSVSLAASMALAALYGARIYLPVAWLDIPWMRALHGSANALGFALAGLLGWALHKASR